MNSRVLSNLFSHHCSTINHSLQQIRTKWVNRWMIRDVKRRKMAAEYGPERLRVNAMRKNDILPAELREIADTQMAAFPYNSSPMRLNYRCVITSRPRGNVARWRLSRFVFRHHADYNKLAGVQRAMW